VYLLLAATLFEGLGLSTVWCKLTAGLDGLDVDHPSGSALAQAGRRLGVAPLRAPFDLLRDPAATAMSAGTRWRGCWCVRSTARR
jgi:hypothetical protein